VSFRGLCRIWVPALVAGTLLFVWGSRARAAAAATFTLHIPCVISVPIQKVASAYEESHPGVDNHPGVRIDTATDKPLALLGAVQEKQAGPGVVLTLGEVEMDALVAAGAVEKAQVVPVARNAYEVAVIVSAKREGISKLSDLTGPKVKRIAVEDPKLSTLGNRAEQAFRKLGWWKKLAPKVVRFDPTKNVLSQLLDGKADAAVVFKDCLFAEGGSPPKTIRLLGTLPAKLYAPITYQAAPLKQAAQSEETQKFVTWLVSADGKKALQEAGLSPS